MDWILSFSHLSESALNLKTVPSKSIPIDHPIRQMARFVDANEWRLQHSTETEISVEIPGKWSDYLLTFTWQDSYAALHVNAFMDIFIVDQQIASAREVITEINSQIAYRCF